MLRALWSREVEGETVFGLLSRSGGDGIALSTSSGCYAIDAAGKVVWQHAGLTIKAEAPDGTLLATKHSGDLIRLDVDGKEIDRRFIGGRWEVIGWMETGRPLLASDSSTCGDEGGIPFPLGAVWDGRSAYALFNGHLHRYDEGGAVQSRVRMIDSPFRDKLRSAGGWMNEAPVELLDRFVNPPAFGLQFDRRHRRLIATYLSMPAWIMALRLDGKIDWLALPSLDCCNFTFCLEADDVVAHLSSCGRRLTFLGASGQVLQTRDFDDPPLSMFRGGQGVCVEFMDGNVSEFNASGEPLWALALPGVERTFAHDRVLCTVRSSDTGTLEIGAFEIPSRS